jgi:hypothetical protein
VFNAKDESGKSLPSDTGFRKSAEKDLRKTLTEMLGFDPVIDQSVIDELKKYLNGLYETFQRPSPLEGWDGGII